MNIGINIISTVRLRRLLNEVMRYLIGESAYNTIISDIESRLKLSKYYTIKDSPTDIPFL